MKNLIGMEDSHIESTQELEELMFISHKLRQPITQILGLSILLTGSCYTQDELKKIIDMMGKSAQSLDYLSRELTTFAHRRNRYINVV